MGTVLAVGAGIAVGALTFGALSPLIGGGLFFSSSIGWSIGVGAIAGAAGGFVAGAGIAWANGASFGQVLAAGGIGALTGAVGRGLAALTSAGGGLLCGAICSKAGATAGRTLGGGITRGAVTGQLGRGSFWKNLSLSLGLSVGSTFLAEGTIRRVFKNKPARGPYANGRSSIIPDLDPSFGPELPDNVDPRIAQAAFAWHLVPGADAISNFHDDWLEHLGYSHGPSAPFFINYGTMIPSALAVGADIGLGTLEYYPW